MSPRARKAGFTLLELVVVIAIVSILAGAAIPVASRAWASAARRATRERLDVLARATLEHFRDVERPPRELGELFVRPDEDAAGWIGPYVALDVPLRDDGRAPAPLDAWSRPITIGGDGERCVLRSLGLDGIPSKDDLLLRVDFTPLRRESTLRELAEANEALASWRAAHPGATLERDWPRALERLCAEGFLPADRASRGRRAHERDAWDRPYVVDPGLARDDWRVASTELLERSRAGR